MTAKRAYILVAALGLAAVSGCTGEAPIGDWGDEDRYPEIGGAYSGLTAFNGTCTFVPASGLMTVDANDNAQTVVIGLRPVDLAVLVNGSTCGTPAATSTTLKRLVVSGGTVGTGAQVLILDFLNGIFAKGTATTRGIDVNLGAGSDDVRIRGTSGNDVFTFGANGISVVTGTFRNIDVTNVENYSVSMAGGNDVVSGAGGNGTTGAFTTPITMFGGAGNDTLTGGDGADTVNGGAGNDTLAGGAGADALNGDGDNDTINQGATSDGGDTIICGTTSPAPVAGETDTVSYALRTTALTVSIAAAGGAADDGEALEGDDVDTTCEIVVGGSADDSLTGDANANTLTGGAGDDTLAGGAGADVLNGGLGDDIFDEESATNGGDIFNGGAGVDVVDYSARTAALTVTMDGVTADDGLTGEADNVKVDVENILGGTSDDTITGNLLDNVLDGGAGNDTLNGGAGNDIFDEGAATNGGDSFNGGAGVDVVDYSGRVAALTVTMDGSAANDGLSGESDNVGADVEDLLGGTAGDSITGNALNNAIDGGAGDDTLDGGTGDDTLDGGTATTTNTLICGAGDDIGYNGTNAAADCEL